MAKHQECRSLNYSSQQIFNIIADVESYPKFLPLWQQAQISRTEPGDHDSYRYHTRQVIQLGPVKKHFYTETVLFPTHCIRIKSNDPLFQQFHIEWILNDLNEHQCQIKFSLHCLASAVLLRPVFDAVLMQSAGTIVSAFARRAETVYGHLGP